MSEKGSRGTRSEQRTRVAARLGQGAVTGGMRLAALVLLVMLAAAATDEAAGGRVIAELPTVTDAPLLRRRVQIDGLQAKVTADE